SSAVATLGWRTPTRGRGARVDEFAPPDPRRRTDGEPRRKNRRLHHRPAAGPLRRTAHRPRARDPQRGPRGPRRTRSFYARRRIGQFTTTLIPPVSFFSSSKPKIKCGVAGVGSLGQHHARIYASLPNVEFM